MSTLIRYDGRIIASGQPVPLVSRSDEMVRYGERWANRTTVTLNGTLTGCTFESIVAAQSGLLRDFDRDFQTLEVVENGNVIYQKPYATIRSVNFGDSRYVGALPYTITVECYEQQYFSGVFGVLDPANEWQFEEQSDGRVQITHTIAARGFNTASGPSNALENAKNYVLSNTGWRGEVYPAFITGEFSSPCLLTFSERIDRFNGNYAVTETYLYDKHSNSCETLRYATDYQCNTLDGRASVTVRGDIQGGVYSNITGLRQRYAAFNVASVATGVNADINPIYIQSGVSEDIVARRLTFEVLFDNLPTDANGVWFDYSTNVETNDQGITRTSLQGSVRGRGDLNTRWSRVQTHYNSLDLYSIVQNAYTSFNGESVPLNPTPLISGNTYNQFIGELGVNVTFDNRPTPSNTNFSEINYNHQVTDAVQQVAAVPLLKSACGSNKSYYVVDLGFANRAEFALEGSARPACGKTAAEVLEELKNEIETIRSAEMAGASRPVLTKHQFDIQNTSDGEQISFSCAWTFDPSTKATSPADYSQINSLRVN